MRLDEVFPRTRTALYSYDYGDGWEIDVKLVDSKTPLTGGSPLCVAGEGDNPPEDVGAEWGFVEFLRAIADPNDPEHDDMVAWGDSQTFEHFDVASTNARLVRYDDWRAKGVYDRSRNAGIGDAAPSGAGASSAAHPTSYRKGALAGLSEDERRAAVDAHIGNVPDPELSDFMLDDPIALLKSASRSGSPKFTLSELLTPLKKDVLVDYAYTAGVEGVPGMKKAELVEAIAAALRDPESLRAFANSVPLAFIDGVCNLVNMGGRLYLPEGKIGSLGDAMPPHEPLVFVYHTKHCFVYVIPDDLLEAARAIDWEDVRRWARLRDKLRKLAFASVELRGIVPVYEYLEECKEAGIGAADDDEIIRLTMEAACTMPLFAFLVTEDDSFLLDIDLANAYLESEGADAMIDPGAPLIQGSLGESLDSLLVLQGDKEPRPVPPAMLECPIPALWREELPAARELRNWLDGHVPDGSDEYRFADRMVSELCDEARWGSGDASSPALYQDILADEGLVLGEEDAGALLDCLTAFLDEQPTWPNNGWSFGELAQR